MQTVRDRLIGRARRRGRAAAPSPLPCAAIPRESPPVHPPLAHEQDRVAREHAALAAEAGHLEAQALRG
jgi:hypothetical protein